MKNLLIYSLLCGIIICLFILNLLCGEVSTWQFGEIDKYIIYSIRLPRTIMCVICGAVLSLSGVVYQAIFRNPLSDPYVLGVSSGASLGATLVIVSGLETFVGAVGLGAFLFSLITVIIIMRLASIGSKLHIATLLLSGVSINFLFSAIIAIFMYIDKEDMHKIYFWTMGSLSGVGLKDCIYVAIISFICIVLLFLQRNKLNILVLGSQTANSLGIDFQKTSKLLLLISTLMCSVIVSVCGVIGFVGLVVPHIVRLIFGPNHNKLVPLSILCGIIFCLMADILARNILSNSDLPIGCITSLIGAPFFIYLLYDAKRKLHY